MSAPPPENFWRRKIVSPVLRLLKSGVTPEKMTLSLVFGLYIGVFPLIGATTILCTIAALVFRLNFPAIQLVNYLSYPLQIAFLLPFYSAGAWLFGAGSLPLSVEGVLSLVRSDAWASVTLLWETTWHAVVVWLLASPVALFLLYISLLPLLQRLLTRTKKSSPGEEPCPQK